MLTVIYDPESHHAVPDGKVRERVAKLIAYNNKYVEYKTTESTGLVIDALRVAVKYGAILTEDVKIMFNGEHIPMDNKGMIQNWPKGFCDTQIDLLIELVDK